MPERQKRLYEITMITVERLLVAAETSYAAQRFTRDAVPSDVGEGWEHAGRVRAMEVASRTVNVADESRPLTCNVPVQHPIERLGAGPCGAPAVVWNKGTREYTCEDHVGVEPGTTVEPRAEPPAPSPETDAEVSA